MPEPLERLKAALADRYHIERELGAGGMATVYLARDLRHDREVAIKVLRPELAATLGPQRFLQEIQIAARLTHPHILPLHDSGQADGFLYYVMPYVEGESLRDRLSREGELPVVEAVRILKEVTDALAYAHGQRVVHRDIKPENVMLSGRHALVTDFGVAKALHEATGRQQLTTAGVALGTPAYMAPEQAAADPHMDHRVDLYAVGAMGYELLAGRPPFTGASPQMVLAAQVTEVPRPVTEHRPAVPPAMAGTIMRCLEKKPADRWQTAEELLSQWEVLASTPSGGMTPTGMQPVTVAARPVAGGRRTLVLGLAAVVVLAAVGGGSWALLNRGGPTLDPRIREPVVVLPFEVRGGDASLGVDAADRITAAIQQAGLGDVVRLASAETGERFTERVGRRVLRETGAATLVVGTIAPRGEGVEVQASVVRGADLKTIWTLGPEQATASDPIPALDAIRERVLGAVGWYLSPATEGGINPGIYQPPSSLEVFRLAQRASELFVAGRQGQAIPLLEEALAADSTYLAARLLLATISWNLRRWQDVGATLAKLETQRSSLYPGDVLQLNWLQALDASPEEEYRAAVALFSADSSQAYERLFTSVRTGRPREALQYYVRKDTTTSWGRNWQAWDVQAGVAYHMLGRFEDELALARAAKTREPRAYGHWAREVRALAAMGRTADVERILAESHALEWVWASIQLRHFAAGELRAHGWAAESVTYYERALAALERLPQDVRKEVWARDVFRAGLEALGRYDVVTARYLAEERAFNLGITGRVLSSRYRAMAGDTSGLRALVDSLRTAPIDDVLRGASLPNRGSALLSGTGILAILGDAPGAVTLLREALNNGARLGAHPALQPSFASIKDYPPFQELVKLKDGN